MAFLVDFARQVIQSGERVVPVAHVKLAFTPVTPVFAAESAAVSALAAAHEAFASGELEAGLDALETAMTAQPRYKAGLETTARFMASVNSPREELTSLTALVKLDARDANARARLGMVAMQLGETELGLTQLATAHALAPDDAAIATVYGQALLRCGKSDEAASMFLTALAASPQHVEAALGAADSLTRLGQSAEALELLRAFDTPAEAPEEALALG
jgi:tetratricopeptide (TPR) repeat protein